MYIFLVVLHLYFTGFINPTTVEYSTRPIVINKDYPSNIQWQIILNLIDELGQCASNINISLSALGLDVFIANNSTVGANHFPLSHVHCFYNLVLLSSTLSGEMFNGSDKPSTSGQASICENGLWGYVNIPPIRPFPHGAVLWIRPNAGGQSPSEKLPATVHQMESLHQVTIVPITDSLHPSGSPINPRLPSTIPILNDSIDGEAGEQHTMHMLMQSVGKALRRQKRTGTMTNSYPNGASRSAPDPVRVYYQPEHSEGPYIVELYMIVDQTLAASFNGRYDLLVYRVNQIVSMVNGLYAPFNILIVVVRLEILEQDQGLSAHEHHLLTTLAQFKRTHVKIRHDCLHALLGIKDRASRTRGNARQQTLCTYSSCVGYTRDSPTNEIAETARTMAHELGHNFGLKHDTEECQCQSCIMATGIEFGRNLQAWSPCSVRDIKLLLEYGMGSCLRDWPGRDQVVIGGTAVGQASSTGQRRGEAVQPFNRNHRTRDLADRVNLNRRSLNSGLCGNGQLDPGEECDCGTVTSCPVELQSCCDVRRCRLKANAECAGGPCCAVTRQDRSWPNGKPKYQCRLKPLGTVCRSESGDCDLPEYCNGTSQWCPADVYKADGAYCRTDEGRWSYCIRGGCRDADSWCRVLWGKTGRRGHEDCFLANLRRDARGQVDSVANCGKQRPTPANRWQNVESWPGIACASREDAECGRLWCHHRNEKVMLLGSKQEDTRKLHTGEVCSALVYDPIWPASDSSLRSITGTLPTAAGSGQRSMVTQDAGMVPDGTRCSKGFCYNGSCVPRSTVRSLGLCWCANGGVCNSLGHCHCRLGFRPPNCEYGGDGGSIDSGPPPTGVLPDPNLIIGLSVFALIVVLAVVFGVWWRSVAGGVCPTRIKSTIETTDNGLVSPFDQGIVAALRRCIGRRIGKANHLSKPSIPDNTENGAVCTGDGWKNGYIFGKSPSVPLMGIVPPPHTTPSIGWILPPEADEKHANHITNNANSHKANGTHNSRAVHKGDEFKSSGVSSSGPKGAINRTGHLNDPDRSLPGRNGYVAHNVNNGVLAVSKCQTTPGYTDGHVKKQVDTVESTQRHSPSAETRGGDAVTDIPLISEPHLKTMTYRGKVCPIEDAPMLACQVQPVNTSTKPSRSKSLTRRVTELSRGSTIRNTLRNLQPKPDLDKSDSRCTTLLPSDISQPILTNTTYNKPLTDLKAHESASQM